MTYIIAAVIVAALLWFVAGAKYPAIRTWLKWAAVAVAGAIAAVFTEIQGFLNGIGQ